VAIHADFGSPILHGLGTFGVVSHAILKGVCNYDTAVLISMSARFSTPVYPNELIRTEIWCDNFTVSFRALATARSAIVSNNGRAQLRSAKSDPMG
jgi:acyl dehydratase